MAKQGMTHPDINQGQKNDVSPVPQLQGKAKTWKEKARPFFPETGGTNLKVGHEKTISKAQGIIGTDLVRDNL